MTLSFSDRSQRGKLRFTGPQRAWFLHQILTQAFEDMGPGESRAAAKLTAHGRMTGFMEFIATEDALYCHFESELKETLPEEIQRYVFATQVTIDDVSDEFGLVLVAGEGWREVAEAFDPIPQETRSLGTEAGYLWVPASVLPEVLQHLESSGARRASEEELEQMRIENVVPRWGREMDVKTFPQEAGIDAWAVHYDKGCYVGQEAMAKIHFRGKVNRRLAKVEGDRLKPGEDILEDGVKVGVVTSVAGDKGLAMVRYTLGPGAEVEVGASTAKVVS